MMLGSKIDNLLKLVECGVNVPKFFVIKHEDVISMEINEFNKDDVIKHIKSIESIEFDNYLDCKLYSVRSSCNLEDGEDNSFAGQFDTYLNVKESDLIKYIKKCFLSLFNDNVFSYINNSNIDFNDLRMNVIVQEMVDADISGVLFTSNPQGILNESVISVAYGLGENVVSDKGDVTNYYYYNTDKVYYYEGKDILSSNNINKLLEEANKIKDILGDYLDIEFAFKDNELYFLQARNITTINDNNVLVLDNSNIVESYPNISLPLTISFVDNVYSNVFRKLVSRVLRDDSEVKKLDVVFNNMTGSVNGRIYYKISNWYSLLKYLPFSKKIIPMWQEMLGVKSKITTSNDVKISNFSKLIVCFNYIRELINSQKNMDKLNKEFININKYYKEKISSDLSNEEIFKLYRKVEDRILNNWDITLVNDMYAFIYTSLLKKYLNKKYKNEEITNKYISGISNIESLKPIKELINLSYNKNNYSKCEFEKLKDDYIELYGDRSLEELKLESKTFRTNRELLDKKIDEYTKDLDKLEEMYNNINKDNKVIVKENFIMRFLVKRVNSGIKNREISRLNRSRVYGMVREMILLIGNNLVKDNIIENERDIFYLKLSEIFKLDDIDYKKLINDRKNTYKNYYKLPAYSRLVFMDQEFDKNIKDVNLNKDNFDCSELRGIPCSFGVVEGEVLVVKNVDEINDVKDKILVTKMTDPGWVFLLATAKGVISEKGSLLSHTAIISRELKIPSIVGVDNLMRILKTGDVIRMDASSGVINIIKRS